MCIDRVLQGERIQHLVEEGNVIGGLRPILVCLGILSSALAASGITSTTTARITSATAGPSSASPSSATSASAPWRCRRWLLRPNSYIPLAAGGVGIDRNDAIFVGQLVKVREPRHVVGILISRVQKDYNRIVLLLIVAPWQVHDVGAGDVIDVDLSPAFPAPAQRAADSSARRHIVKMHPSRGQNRGCVFITVPPDLNSYSPSMLNIFIDFATTVSH